MVEFRLHADRVIQRLRKGEPLTLTYRGHPLAQLLPIKENKKVREDDPFYRLYDHADPDLKPMTNEEIDATLYGKT